MSAVLRCGTKSLSLDRAHVMGVLNVTPDSFSDGGKYTNLEQAFLQARRMVDEGASLIDVGGESTRPGARAVSVQAELDRVCPIIEKLGRESEVVVSVDTSTPEVMREAIKLGCGMVNDVRAFTRAGAIDAVGEAAVALCVMHMQGEPKTMQQAPEYQSVVDDVCAYLLSRMSVLVRSDIDRARIVFDPGFGFGKSLAHNLELLANLDRVVALECPVLVGMSRKSMIGAMVNKEVDQRLYGSLSAAVIALMKGARIIRTHDVAATMDALKVAEAVAGAV